MDCVMNNSETVILTELLASLKSKIKCSICQEPVEDCIELKCSHKICSNCYTTKFRSQCPSCETPITKNCPLYKDNFANSLSIFVKNLDKLINNTPTVRINSPTEGNMFQVANKLPQTSNFNRTVRQQELESPENVDNGTKSKVIEWLNKNEQSYNVLIEPSLPELTNSPEKEAKIFCMNSISQVASKKMKNPQGKYSSECFIETPEVSDPFLKKNLKVDDGENYEIEDINSEEIVCVKEAENRVLQRVLEDHCLVVIDKLAERERDKNMRTEKGTDRNILKYLDKKPKKIALQRKMPKQLKIHLINDAKLHNELFRKMKEQENIEKSKSDASDKTTEIDEDSIDNDNNISLCSVDTHILSLELSQNKSDDTQIIESSNKFLIIDPCSNGLKNINEIATVLSRNLQSCLNDAAQYSKNLEQCFINILTYSKKIKELSSIMNFKDVSVQTKKLIKSCDKSMQTSMQNYSVSVHQQTNIVESVDKIIQVTNKVAESEVSSVEIIDSQTDDLPNIADVVIAKDNNQKLIKPLKSILANNEHSENVSGKSKFKRIRLAPSQSDSDEDIIGTKKRFIRNDLSVEFVDSEASKFASENDKIDNEQYLLEVMSKYDPESQARINNKSQKKSQIPTLTNSPIRTTQRFETDHVFTNLIENNFENIEKSFLKETNDLEIISPTPIVNSKPTVSRKVPIQRTVCRTIENVTETDDVEELLECARNDKQFFDVEPLLTAVVNNNSDDDIFSQEMPDINFTETLNNSSSIIIHKDKTEKKTLLQKCNSVTDVENIIEITSENINKSPIERRNSCSNEEEMVINYLVTPPPAFADEAMDVNDETEETHKDMQGLTEFLITPETEKKSMKEKNFASYKTTPNYSQVLNRTPRESVTPVSVKSRLSLKKKFNLLTSTPNQTSILNYVQDTQNSPKTSLFQKSIKSKPHIMWSRITNKDLNIFSHLERRKLLTISTTFHLNVTHLIVLVDEYGRIETHTAKILQAIAAGIWIVRFEWAEDCLKQNRIVDEEPYEVLDKTGEPGPKLARTLRETKPLFKGFKFFCAPQLINISKTDLETILNLCGAETAKNVNEFLINDNKIHLIITEDSFSDTISSFTQPFQDWLENYKTISVLVDWLTTCLGKYKLESFKDYLVYFDETLMNTLNYPPELLDPDTQSVLIN